MSNPWFVLAGLVFMVLQFFWGEELKSRSYGNDDSQWKASEGR